MAFATLASLAVVGAARAQPADDPGLDAYRQRCATCHGQHLDDGEFAPPLKGEAFRKKWAPLGQAALSTYVTHAMPPGQVGELGAAEYDQVVAYVARANGIAAK